MTLTILQPSKKTFSASPIVMLKPLLVIKLGGAALTDKRKIYTPRIRVIRSVAKQVSAIKEDFSVVLVHGAGSYGHIPVKKFNLSDGFQGSNQLRGLSHTKLKLLQWHITLAQAFRQYHVPIMPMVSSDLMVTRNGRIKTCKLSGVERWLGLGCVVMMGGDIVPDELSGFSVLSGDQIASYLATELGASKLIFGTDVDGIFESNPRFSRNARLLAEISISSARDILTEGEGVTDVTGGMRGKLTESSAAAAKGIPVIFMNLMKPNRLQRVAYGQRAACSRMVR